MKLARITGFRLVTQDVEALVRFYAALGFEADDERPIDAAELALLGVNGRGTRRPLRLDDARIDLDRFDRGGSAYPQGADAASACFQHFALTTGDIAATWNVAVGAGALAISRDGPVTLPSGTGGVTAVKFRDPEGHPLELIHFPGRDAGIGGGVLGVDHSAIVATDLVASQAFYTDLGMTAGDVMLNHGPTQQALDGLDDVRVDVVPMIPSGSPPHVESLHYRSPVAPLCQRWAVDDVVATRIVWAGGAPALLRDPDGHLHQVDS